MQNILLTDGEMTLNMGIMDQFKDLKLGPTYGRSISKIHLAMDNNWDVIIFYFSGHGSYETAKKDSYILLRKENKAIDFSSSELVNEITKPCSGTAPTYTFILDCCDSVEIAADIYDNVDAEKRWTNCIFFTSTNADEGSKTTRASEEADNLGYSLGNYIQFDKMSAISTNQSIFTEAEGPYNACHPQQDIKEFWKFIETKSNKDDLIKQYIDDLDMTDYPFAGLYPELYRTDLFLPRPKDVSKLPSISELDTSDFPESENQDSVLNISDLEDWKDQ